MVKISPITAYSTTENVPETIEQQQKIIHKKKTEIADKNPPQEKNNNKKPEDKPVQENKNGHKIVQGETLYSIANSYGTTVAELIKANPNLKKDKNGNRIIEKDSYLIIPKSAKTQSTTKSEGVTNGQKYGSWQIELGKGAFSIMTKFNLYKEELQKLNPHIDLDKIKAFDVFNVPGYKIKNGDTYASIAQAHDITEQMLRELNPNVKTLTAGSILNVPKKAGEELALEEDIEVEVEEVEFEDRKSHTLAKGETLYRISQQYKVPVWALMVANNITDEKDIPKNTVLEIPTADDIAELDRVRKIAETPSKPFEVKPQPLKHKVAKDESLSVIAKKYKVPEWALISKNNINNPNILSVNQVLDIPTKEDIEKLKNANVRNKIQPRVKTKTVKKKITASKKEVKTETGAISQNAGLINHRIKPNDNIRSIAKEYGVSVKDLIAYNKNLKGLSLTLPLSSQKVTSLKIVGNQSAVRSVTGVSQKFIDDLISIEKKRNTLYKDDCGKYTIGIGHNATAHKDVSTYKGRKLKDTEIYSLLARDIIEAQDTLKKALGESYNKLSTGQKEALYCLIFNTGSLSQSPKLVAAIKKGDWTEAACQMDHASGTINGKKQVLPGLAKRRFMEISTFVSGSNLNSKQLKKVMNKTQNLYNLGYANIKNSNSKVDYNAYARKFLGKYIDKGYIEIKEQV